MLERPISNKPLLPFSALVLYTKGWLKFPWIKDDDENRLYKELEIVLRMCGYMAFSKSEIVSHIANAVDVLKEHINKDKNNYFIRLFSSIYLFVSNLDDYYNRLSYCKDKDEAFIRFCLSEISRLNINDVSIRYIDYKKDKIKTCNTKISTTYTECQNKFNKTFKDLISVESFEFRNYYYCYLKESNLKLK